MRIYWNKTALSLKNIPYLTAGVQQPAELQQISCIIAK